MPKKDKKALKKAARAKIVDVEKALTTGPIDKRKVEVEKALAKGPRAKGKALAEEALTAFAKSEAEEAVKVAGADPDEEQPCYLCETHDGKGPRVKRKDGYCFGCHKFICDTHGGNTPMGAHEPEAHDENEDEGD